MKLHVVLGYPVDCFLKGARDEFVDDDLLCVVVDVVEEEPLHQSPKVWVDKVSEHTIDH